MNNYLKNKGQILKFAKPKTHPTVIWPHDSTTVLSPYLKFGCLSVRLLHQKIVEIEKGSKNKSTKPPMSLRGQLYWREFFYTCGYKIKNFDKMDGNPVCLQVDWECKNFGDSNDKLDAWSKGKTGFPWIDAVMTQLRIEGWIHHLARHAVACFLTRGDLYVSWERGKEVFEELLLDADWSLNAGNWLWLRVYSPIAFPKKTDPDGKFVKHWIPQLKNYDKKFIYEPWKAPKDLQKKWGCIIGKDYPSPIVDHDEAKKEGMAKMKEAYANKQYGKVKEDINKFGKRK